MALVLKDRIKETSSTTGTGTLTLGGAVDGFRSFADIGDGNTTYYCIADGNNFEVGIGTYTASGTTLARTTVLQTSAGNTTKITCTGNQKVFVTQPASKAAYLDASNELVVASTALSSIQQRWTKTATSNQTVFNGAADNSGPTLAVNSSSHVFLNGIFLKETTDYALSGGTTVTLTSGATVNDIVEVITFTPLSSSITGISDGDIPVFTSGVADNDFLKVAGTSIEGRSASEVLSDIGGQSALTFGISSGNVPTFTSGVADNDFLKIDGTTVEGRSASEVLSDIGGQASLTFGISNTNAVKIDSSSVADDEYARFTANGLESRSTSEVLSDIGGQASLTFGISNTNAVKIDSTSVADDEYARFTANGLESRSTAEVLSDIGALSTSSASSTYAPLSNPTFTGTSGITAGGLLLNDNGHSGNILSVRTDDDSPWAFRIGNDSVGTSAGYSFYQHNNGTINHYSYGNGSYVNTHFHTSDGSGNVTYMRVDTNGSVNITPGTGNGSNDASLYVNGPNANDWGMVLNKASGDYGLDIRGTTGSYALRILSNNAEKFRVTWDGTTYSQGSVYAPIFYDVASTSYYMDAAGTSVLNSVFTAGTLSVNTTSTLNSVGQLGIYSSSSPYISFHNGTLDRTAYIQESGGAFYLNEATFTEMSGSARAPLFYDNGNTAYYVDPYSTSVLNYLNIYGTLQVAGNSGTSGQVLTSNGGAAPSWQDAGGSEWETVTDVQLTSGNDTYLDITVTRGYYYRIWISDHLVNNTGGARKFEILFHNYTHGWQRNESNAYLLCAGYSEWTAVNTSNYYPNAYGQQNSDTSYGSYGWIARGECGTKGSNSADFGYMEWYQGDSQVIHASSNNYCRFNFNTYNYYVQNWGYTTPVVGGTSGSLTDSSFINKIRFRNVWGNGFWGNFRVTRLKVS
tara:strand:+ start:1064 stop:3808 length:2745 start_codon:yes stop_codon:yes gene_type:complete